MIIMYTIRSLYEKPRHEALQLQRPTIISQNRFTELAKSMLIKALVRKTYQKATQNDFLRGDFPESEAR